MFGLNTDGLMERSAHEYREALRVALDADDRLDLERINTWSASRRVVLAAALKRAGLEELATSIPPAPKAKRRDKRTPTQSEIVEMRNLYGTLPHGERACVFLLLQMGLRADEVLKLPRREVEQGVQSGELSFTRKGDYKAILPCAHAAPLLEELLESESKCGKAWKRAGEILSCGGEGTQYVRLYRLCKSLGNAVGFRGLHPHLLRHAFASQMNRRGAPLTVIQKALGHADIKTTQIYVHADKSDVEKYVEVWNP